VLANQAKFRVKNEVPVRCSYTRLEPVSKLKPNPSNPNKHDAAQLGLYAKILRHQGWRKPIVVSNRSGLIVCGHGAYLTALAEGWSSVPIDVQEFASKADEIAHLIADNRLPQLSEISDVDLSGLLKELNGFDLEITGFDSTALSELDGFSEPSEVDADPQIDRAAELQKEWKTKLGQVWRLGDHMIACGSCTDSKEVSRLLDGNSIRLVWTDPPYGVGYEEKCKHLEKYRPQNRASSVVSSDDMTADQTEELATKALGVACENADKGCSIYVAVPAGPLHARFQSAIQNAGFQWKHTLVWVKNHFVMGRSDYHYRHEPILFGWKDGAAHYWAGGRDKDTVFQVDKPTDSDLHPTMKPVELVSQMVKNSSRLGDVVYEPFSGSGTTIIACEQLGRKARAMEISPAYVAVALQRFKDATGKTPELLK